VFDSKEGVRSPAIVSAQNPAQPLAGRGRRFGASLIDSVLLLVVYTVPILGIFIGLVYALVRDALPFLGGQSIGKKAMGIRAMKEASRQPITGDYGASIIRQISLLIPLFGVIDALMVFSSKRQRFGDRWARTIVVLEQ
jgi:uncharacterized RDD family membrane protein YckC